MAPTFAAASDLGQCVYRGSTFTLLTRHGKERVIAPAFETALAARVELVTGFDTDLLGTFTRDVERAGSQLDAARAKARIGMELSGSRLGLASEGSFGPGPLGFLPSNLELVILLDDERGIEVVGRAHDFGRHVREQVATHSELATAARSAGLPEHGVVLSAEDDGRVELRKGLDSWPALRAAFDELRSASPRATLFVENDLRAHMNPTRMATIAAATRDLVQRLLRSCPACGSPGFGWIEKLPGLPCRDCGAATERVRAERLACVACDHHECRELGAPHADPADCPECNP